MTTGYFRSKQYKWAECYLYIEWTSRKKDDRNSYLDIDMDVQCMRLNCIQAPAYMKVFNTSGGLIGQYHYTAPAYNKGSGFSRADMGFHTFTVPHNADGTMTVDIECYWRSNLTDGYSGVYIPELYARGRVTLVPVSPEVPDPPGSPVNLQATGLFESGQNINLTWQKGPGEVTKYSLFYRLRSVKPEEGNTEQYGDTYIETIFPATSYTFTVPNMADEKFKFGYQIDFLLKAINDGGSAEARSNALTHYGIRSLDSSGNVTFGKIFNWTGNDLTNITGRFTPDGGRRWHVFK